MTKFYRYLFTRSELRGILILSMGVILIRVLAYSLDQRLLPGEEPKSGENLQPGLSMSDSTAQVRPARKKLEINSADSIALLDLTGIGPSFSRRIVKYREMLGGYFSLSQLAEVYGMDSLRLKGFITEIRLDTSRLRKLNLNSATFKELLAHPYLDYDQVKAISRFRDRRGMLDSPGELWAAGVLPDSLWSKLSHYLVATKDSVIIGK